MEDRIPRWLQHRYKTCCKKGGRHRRWACMIQRWFHCGNIVSGQVDLHMTILKLTQENSMEFLVQYIYLYILTINSSYLAISNLP